MAVPRRHPRSTHDTSAYQLTLADWEREQAGEALETTEPATAEPIPSPRAPTRETTSTSPSTARLENTAVRRSRTRSITGDGFEARQLLTVSEVARATGLSANAIYRAIASGELRASKLRGQLRIQNSDVEAWVDAARVPVRATRADQRPSLPTPRAQTPARSRPARAAADRRRGSKVSRQTRLHALSRSERR